MTTQLSPTQESILDHAAQTTDGKITWFPDNIKGGARTKVLGSLFKHALITPLGDDWFVTAEGYDALDLPRRAPITPAALEAVIANAEIEALVIATEVKAHAETKTPRTRDNSKQAQVIAMLKRPEGATIAQIMDATGWQAHTVRGTFAGAFKKKLGLDITSSKEAGGERVYHVAAAV